MKRKTPDLTMDPVRRRARGTSWSPCGAADLTHQLNCGHYATLPEADQGQNYKVSLKDRKTRIFLKTVEKDNSRQFM